MAKLPTKKYEKHGAYLSSYGEDIVASLDKHNPDPCLLVGDTGWGKTTVLKAYANANKREFTGVNFYPRMSVDTLVGMWRPQNGDNGVSVEWQDGLLTQAVRSGHIFMGEELTRAPRDLAGRILGLLDSANRYWSIPEAGLNEIPVDENFWFVASANPTSGNYATVSLDAALLRRFSYVCEIEQPIADEEKVITAMSAGVIHNHEDFTERMLKWVADLRSSRESAINTGDLVRVVDAMVRKQIKPVDALTHTLKFKYPQFAGILTAFGAHLETFDLKWTSAKAKASVPAPTPDPEPAPDSVADAEVEGTGSKDVVTAPDTASAKSVSDLMSQLQSFIDQQDS